MLIDTYIEYLFECDEVDIDDGIANIAELFSC